MSEEVGRDSGELSVSLRVGRRDGRGGEESVGGGESIGKGWEEKGGKESGELF